MAKYTSCDSAHLYIFTFYTFYLCININIYVCIYQYIQGIYNVFLLKSCWNIFLFLKCWFKKSSSVSEPFKICYGFHHLAYFFPWRYLIQLLLPITFWATRAVISYEFNFSPLAKVSVSEQLSLVGVVCRALPSVFLCPSALPQKGIIKVISSLGFPILAFCLHLCK